MKPFTYLLILSGVAAATFYGCNYNNEAQLNPAPSTGCDTTTITYAVKIVPIFNTNCMVCHGSSVYQSNGGGVNLQGYDNQKANINIIYDAVYYGIMPKTGPKLDDCSIKAIRIWKNAGTPNN